MAERWSLRAQKQRRGEKPSAAVADALRNNGDSGNNGDGPSNRSPFGPDRPSQLGPNGAGRPQGTPQGGGMGWLPRLVVLFLVLVVAYELFAWLGPSNATTITYKYSDFITQVDDG